MREIAIVAQCRNSFVRRELVFCMNCLEEPQKPARYQLMFRKDSHQFWQQEAGIGDHVLDVSDRAVIFPVGSKSEAGRIHNWCYDRPLVSKVTWGDGLDNYSEVFDADTRYCLEQLDIKEEIAPLN